MNKVIICGRLGRDPETRTTGSGTIMGNLNIATNHRKKEGDEWIDATEWHRVIVFGRTAEIARDYLAKGREALIEGRIQTRSYDKDGVQTYITEIVADRLELIGGRADNQRDETAAPATTNHRATAASGGSNSAKSNHDDIPF